MKRESFGGEVSLSLWNRSNLLVHLELGVAVLEEGINLLGCCNTGIGVSLGSLGTHLLGR